MAPKTIAALTALLASLPSSALAQTACAGTRDLTPCEIELFDAAGAWEERAMVLNQRWSGCMDKLRVRTASVAAALVPPDPQTGVPVTSNLIILGATGAVGLVLGVFLGVFLE